MKFEQLSEVQQQGVLSAQAWLESFDPEDDEPAGNNGRPWFVIQGYAGTGKSTIVKALVDRLGVEAAYMTYTGKAALVLQRYGGLPATTIHRRIYRPVGQDQALLNALADERDNPETSDIRRAEIMQKISEELQLRFVLRDIEEEEGPTFPEQLIVLDECSMVDDQLLGDLLSFRVPIIALGDPGQLPPVSKDRNGPNEGALFRSPPDVMLTEIHRQAADNPIIDFSMRARKRLPVPHSTWQARGADQRAECLPLSGLTQRQLFEQMQEHDVTICWRNETRHYLNKTYRMGLGVYQQSPVYPIAGDRLICVKNDRDKGLLNGLFCEVVEVVDLYDSEIKLAIRTELQPANAEPQIVSALRAKFDEADDPGAMKMVRSWQFSGTQQFEFGYAITAHKSQGSQWPRVLILDAYHPGDKRRVFQWQKAAEDRARWLYTSITRAAENVRILHA